MQATRTIDPRVLRLCGLLFSATLFTPAARSQNGSAAKPSLTTLKAAPNVVWRQSGSPVTGLAVAPGRVLLTDGSDTVTLYDPSGKLQKTFGPHTADDFRVFSYDAAISPDGKYGLVASVDLAARWLDLKSEKVLGGLSGGMSRLNAVAYAPDGKTVALATASGVLVATLPERHAMPGYKGLTAGAGSIAFAPDGATLAVGGEDKSVRLFKVADGTELSAWHEHEGAVRALAWSPDGKKLASGSRDGAVRIWDIAAGKRLAAIDPTAGAVESLAWSAGGNVLAVAVSPSGKESSARPSEPERNAPGPAESPQPVVQIWVVQGERATLKRAIGSVYGARKIAFGPDHKLIVGFADGRVAAYDLAAIPLVKAVAPRTSRTLNHNPISGSTPAAATAREDAAGIRALTGLAGGAQVVAFSRDGALLAAGNAEAAVGLWDAHSGAFVRRISGHEQGVNSLAWSPDGTLLASGGEDRLQVARVADGKPVWSVPGRAILAGFAPDGKMLFAFVDSSKTGVRAPHVLHGWNALDGTPGDALGSLSYPMRSAISPDGTMIAADQGISGARGDVTTLHLFASSRAAQHRLPAFSYIRGRVRAMSWPAAARLLVEEGDYRDGHTDYDKPIPGKLGVRVFNPVMGGETKPLKVFEMPIVGLDENARGELAVAEDRRAVRVFDAQQHEIATWSLSSQETHVKSVAWAPDGTVLAIGIEGEPIRLWRVQRGTLTESP